MQVYPYLFGVCDTGIDRMGLCCGDGLDGVAYIEMQSFLKRGK